MEAVNNSSKPCWIVWLAIFRGSDRMNETNLNLTACKVMLRNCKVDAVVVGSVFCYNEITKWRRISLWSYQTKSLSIEKRMVGRKKISHKNWMYHGRQSAAGKTEPHCLMHKTYCRLANCSMLQQIIYWMMTMKATLIFLPFRPRQRKRKTYFQKRNDFIW